jgi:penicillin-binding protein 1C
MSKKIAIIILSIPFIFIILDRLYPLDTNRLYKPSSTMIYDREDKLLNINLSEDGFLRMPIDNIDIDNNIKILLLSYEDRYFYYHFGINPFAIFRAIIFNFTNQRLIGASTLTMQVARIMHNKPRTIKSKFIEMFMAIQLEIKYSKDEILKIYLNNTPYGGNIEGIGSASYIYFGKKVNNLSLAELAYLVSIPKNPNINRPKRNNKANILSNLVLKRAYLNGQLSKSIYQRALKENILPNRAKLPNQIPHISRLFHSGGNIHTTINSILQNQIEKIIKERMVEIGKLGIHNAMALVIDNSSMDILAYIGSQDFNDKKYSGEVDGIRALISAGSTLKPLVYAKALDMGIVTPLKNIYDMPLDISGYKPLNYSREFLGEISTKEALWLSLNIPAIELDMFLENQSLYSILKKVNIKSLDKPKQYYGSSLVLGGFGITLKDIAELFSSLANGGIYQKSTILKYKRFKDKKKILSKEASYIISQILADAPRVKFSSSWEYINGVKKVAFKTGTSAGARDMLTIGYNAKYCVAIWFGNFSGKMPKQTKIKDDRYSGLKTSSPTLFDIFSVLKDSKWFKKPTKVIKKKICVDAIKVGECINMLNDDVIEGVTIKTPCKILRVQTLSTLLKSNTKIDGLDKLKNHRCYNKWKEYKPVILSPINREKITQNATLPKELKEIKLECLTLENNKTILWFIDNEPPIKAISGVPIFKYLDVGRHKIDCLDAGSKMKSINIDMVEI